MDIKVGCGTRDRLRRDKKLEDEKKPKVEKKKTEKEEKPCQDRPPGPKGDAPQVVVEEEPSASSQESHATAGPSLVLPQV